MQRAAKKDGGEGGRVEVEKALALALNIVTALKAVAYKVFHCCCCFCCCYPRCFSFSLT